MLAGRPLAGYEERRRRRASRGTAGTAPADAAGGRRPVTFGHLSPFN